MRLTSCQLHSLHRSAPLGHRRDVDQLNSSCRLRTSFAVLLGVPRKHIAKHTNDPLEKSKVWEMTAFRYVRTLAYRTIVKPTERIQQAAEELIDSPDFQALVKAKAAEVARELDLAPELVAAAIADRATVPLREDFARRLAITAQVLEGGSVTRVRGELARLLGYSSYQGVERRLGLLSHNQMGRDGAAAVDIEADLRNKMREGEKLY